MHQSNITILRCNHQFCTECIDPWIANSSTCPTCRDPISYQHGYRNQRASTPNEQRNMENTLTLLRINDLVLVGFFLLKELGGERLPTLFILPAVYACIIPYLQWGDDNGFIKYYDIFCEARMIFKVHAILSLLCGLPSLLSELDSWRIRMVYLPLFILILVRLIHHWVHLSYRKYSAFVINSEIVWSCTLDNSFLIGLKIGCIYYPICALTVVAYLVCLIAFGGSATW